MVNVFIVLRFVRTMTKNECYRFASEMTLITIIVLEIVPRILGITDLYRLATVNIHFKERNSDPVAAD